jgi:hypothetical protein
MTTEAQKAANRRNALRSTGPRTEAGLARSSRNALRHGLTAQRLMLTGESLEDFHQLRQDLYAELAPGGAIESQLIEKLAALMWRLERAPAFEVALFAWITQFQDERHSWARSRGSTHPVHVEPAFRSYANIYGGQQRLGRTVEELLSDRDALSKLIRYEIHLTGQIEKTLQLLAQAQSARLASENDEAGEIVSAVATVTSTMLGTILVRLIDGIAARQTPADARTIEQVS